MTDIRRQQLRRARRKYYRRVAAEFVAASLTTRGTWPIYRRRPELAGLTGRVRRNARLKLDRRELRLICVTTRGTIRRQHFTGKLNGLSGRDRVRAFYNLRLIAKQAVGLTYRGTQRTKKPYTHKP
jgi:hypothetical protein